MHNVYMQSKQEYWKRHRTAPHHVKWVLILWVIKVSINAKINFYTNFFSILSRKIYTKSRLITKEGRGNEKMCIYHCALHCNPQCAFKAHCILCGYENEYVMFSKTKQNENQHIKLNHEITIQIRSHDSGRRKSVRSVWILWMHLINSNYLTDKGTHEAT